MAAPERALLAAEVEAAAALLRQELHDPATDPVHSLAAARSLRRIADEALRVLVGAARNRGESWQRIGDALGTSRQAAFQRFGTPTDPRTGAPMNRSTLPDAPERALALVRALAEHHWSAAEEGLSPAVAEALGTAGLADAWAGVVALVGELERTGEPVVLSMAEVTVVELPLHHEAGDLLARVSFGADAQVVGLWFLPPDAALAPVERSS